MSDRINRVIKALIFSDFIFNSGWGLIAPVFAIFLVQEVALSNPSEGAKIAGFASLIFWAVKSLLQIPISHYLDKNHGEKDDLWFMVGGTLLVGFVPFGFIFASQSWHIYGLQVPYALGMAMSFPSWNAIFTRHIDKGKEAVEWGARSTFVGFATGLTGAIGGILVALFGFKIIFVLVGIFSILSALLLLLIRKEIIPQGKLPPVVYLPRFPL